jgi:hypothetical protein
MNSDPGSFEVLPGLPPYGDLPKFFSYTGTEHFKEAFVIRFFPRDGEPWVGNFKHGGTSFDDVYYFVESGTAVVISHGAGYLVDVDRAILIDSFGGAASLAVEVREFELLVLVSSTNLIGVNGSGVLWKSKRIAWDGIRNLEIEGRFITGEAWSFEDVWIPFRLDAATGEHSGGASIL